MPGEGETRRAFVLDICSDICACCTQVMVARVGDCALLHAHWEACTLSFSISIYIYISPLPLPFSLSLSHVMCS